MDSTEQTAVPAADGPVGPDRLRELYTGPPGEFVTRRKDLAASVRAAGDKDAARRVAAFRKPTTPAWVLNLLAVDGRTAPELLELAGQIVAAVTAGERAELRALAAAQRILLTDVSERVSGLAAAAGSTIPPAALEAVQAAIRGVLADPSTAGQLFTGVLVDLPDPDDVGALPALAIRSHQTSPAAPAPAPRAKRTGRGKAAETTSKPSATRSATDRTRQLRAVRDAASTLRAAERSRARHEKAVRELEDQRDRLDRELRQVHDRLAVACDALETAVTEVEQAERTLQEYEQPTTT